MIQELYDALKLDIGAEIELELGSEHLNATSAPPRIIIVPTSEQFAPNEPITVNDINQKSLLCRLTVLEFHCWGLDFNDTENLIGNLVNALARVQGLAYLKFRGGFWLSDENWATHGRVYVLNVEVKSYISKQDLWVKPLTLETSCNGLMIWPTFFS